MNIPNFMIEFQNSVLFLKIYLFYLFIHILYLKKVDNYFFESNDIEQYWIFQNYITVYNKIKNITSLK